MKTRFGSKRLGYFWAILEPAAIIIVFWAMFGLAMRGGLTGVDYPMFLLTGMMPFQLFANIVTKSMAAFEANQGLFSYRQVKPFDTLVTRCLVECVVYLIVFVILALAGMALGFSATIHDFLGLTLVLFMLVGFSFSFGLICAVIGVFSENFKKVIGILMRPLFFASGIFFAVSLMPEKYRGVLLLNPLLHFLELIRVHYFETFRSPDVSYLYIISWTAGCCCIGLWLYVRLKDRVVMSS